MPGLLLHVESHIDHLSSRHLDEVLNMEATQDLPVAEKATVLTLNVSPQKLFTALCGPLVGDAPIDNNELIVMVQRGDRAWKSKMIHAPLRPTSQVTVVYGPYKGHDNVLYTVYPGPTAPRETTELNCLNSKGTDEMRASYEFWAQHALAIQLSDKPKNLVGLSLSFCVCALLRGDVKLDQVQQIIPAFECSEFDDPNWRPWVDKPRWLDSYEKSYWAEWSRTDEGHQKLYNLLLDLRGLVRNRPDWRREYQERHEGYGLVAYGHWLVGEEGNSDSVVTKLRYLNPECRIYR